MPEMKTVEDMALATAGVGRPKIATPVDRCKKDGGFSKNPFSDLLLCGRNSKSRKGILPQCSTGRHLVLFPLACPKVMKSDEVIGRK